MKAELESARQLADLLDEFRPVERFTPEERGFIELREQFEAFEASRDEQTALRQNLAAIQRRARVFPLQWRAVEAVVVVLLVVAALLTLPHLIGGTPSMPTLPQKQESPAGFWQGASLSPDVCSGRAMDDHPEVYERLGIGNLNGQLLGGGQLESGDFLFDYWLVCDFQFENSSRYLASEISGLAMALKWTYKGPGQDGPIVLYTGIEPYLNESSRSETAATDQSGNEFRGIELPDLLLADWYGQDTPLRYAIKAELPDGSLAGAALTFTLMHEADGFRPLDIQLVPLSETELASAAGVEVSEAPFALLIMDAEYPQLAGIHTLLALHEQTLLKEAGWIHQAVDSHVAASGESLTASDYRGDYWTQVDGQGNLQAEVTQLYMDGRLVNQTVTQDNEAGVFSADNGLMGRLLDAARFGTPAEQAMETIDGVDAWVFTFTDAFLNGPILDEASGKLVYQAVTREAVDAQSGEYLFRETQEFDENGKQVNSTRDTWSAERVDGPPEDILKLLASPPQGVDYPNIPLEVPPEVCANPQTPGKPSGGQMGIGGGTLTSGEVEFELWLICADRFKREADPYNPNYSQIDRLGFAVTWKYTGAAMDGALIPYGGIEPYVDQLFDAATGAPIEPGLSSSSEFGFNLPMTVIADWRAADSRLRYVTKVRLPDGRIEGAALEFTLARWVTGFLVVDVTLEPLSEVERAAASGVEVSAPPFALIPPGVQYPALAEIWPLIEQRMAEFIGEGGLFHMVWEGSDGSITEGRYLVDERRKVWRMSMGVRDATGELIPSMAYQDGYLAEIGGDESGYIPPYDVSMFEYGTLIDDLMMYARSGQPLERVEETVDGRLMWVYSFRRKFTALNIGGESVRVNRYALDAQTGELLFQERYEGKDDASLALVSRTTRVVDERIQQTPEELELMGLTPNP